MCEACRQTELATVRALEAKRQESGRIFSIKEILLEANINDVFFFLAEWHMKLSSLTRINQVPAEEQP